MIHNNNIYQIIFVLNIKWYLFDNNNHASCSAWICFNDRMLRDEYAWLDSQKSGLTAYSNWRPGYPQTNVHEQVVKDVVKIGQKGLWKNENWQVKLNYWICNAHSKINQVCG